MGVVLDPNEIIYPPKWSRQATPSKVFVVPQELRPFLPEKLAEEHRQMRLGPQRAAYWRGVDWRKLAAIFPGILEPFDQQVGEDCVGPAVAAALRLNLAIHRRTDPGRLNRHFISRVATARGAVPRSEVTGLIEDALAAVDQYGTPTNPQDTPVPPGPLDEIVKSHFDAAAKQKSQGFDRLGAFLGQWSAWLHFSGPIVVQMNIERERFDALGKAGAPSPPLIKYDPGKAQTGVTTFYASHVVVVVGYIPNVDSRTPDTFVVLNSFGKGWGEQGIAYIDVDTAQKCFIAGYGFTFREHFGYTYAGKMKCWPFMRRVKAPRV
jgi:hypothetical protein